MQSSHSLPRLCICTTMLSVSGWHHYVYKVIQAYLASVIGAITSIIHLLPHFDHLPSPLALLVETIVTQYDYSRIVADLLG